MDGVGGDTEQWAVGLLKPWSGAKYVTLVTPLLHDTDSLGLLNGAFQAGLSLHNTAFQVTTRRLGRFTVSFEKQLGTEAVTLPADSSFSHGE